MHPFFADLLVHLEDRHNDIIQVLDALPREALDWSPGSEMNSITVLIAHLTGAERYWIGDVACSLRSERDRGAEFRTTGLSADALKVRLHDSLSHARQAVATLTLDDLAQERPSWRDGKSYRVGWALLHALEHTATHTGHIQIQRQIWDQKKSSRHT